VMRAGTNEVEMSEGGSSAIAMFSVANSSLGAIEGGADQHLVCAW
jgi:hypothetical protein